MTTNQFHDYYYPGPTLQSMNFFDFARSVKLEKKTNNIQNTSESCPDVLVHHMLLPQHQLADTHHLLQFWNEEQGHKSFLAHLKPVGAFGHCIPGCLTK